MKKLIAAILALTMVFALCACGSTSAAPAAATEAPAADATVEDIAAADAAPEYADSINILVYPD